MLAAHEQPLAVEERLLAAGAEPPARERVGPYRLVRLLGRGGMGEVFLAERADGEYRGQVAIKLLAGGAGFFGKERERRLRHERQILASLRHPGIAALYDGGITADGQPYLVMEHVDGVPIDRYCNENHLPVRERLELFARVCDAVQYAHARLVVHRDLKPSNLLVTPDGASKLLDFGIAKMLDGSSSFHAGEATRAFTPRRAAPEQLRGEPVSTATDVYALGLLLFELLGGRLPFEEDPPRLPRELRGDLEAIVGKALALRSEDRYAAAGFLAEDVRRHLAGEPVQARRQTRLYRATRFVKRHAFSVALALLAGLALAGMAWFAAGQARRAAQERDLALASMDSLVDLLALADPVRAGGDQVPAADFLDRAERRALSLKDSEVAARLLLALGRVQRERTDFAAAERLLTAARVRDPQDEAVSTDVEFELGQTIRDLGKKEDARRLLTRARERRRARLGDRHPDVFAVTLELLQIEPAATALPRLERLLAEERAVLPSGSLIEADTLNALGAARFRSGNVDAARRCFEESAAILDKTASAPQVFKLTVLGNLAATLDDPRRQEAIHRQRIAAAAALYGSGSTVVAYASNNLGVALALQGRHAEADRAFRRGYDIFATRLGKDHLETANALRNLGRSHQLQRRYPEALAALRAARAVFAGRGTPREEAAIGYQVARVAWLVERSPEALADLRDAARALADHSTGPRDPYPADALVALGLSLLEAERPREAAEVLQRAWDLRRALGREEKEMVARCALRLAQPTSDPRELRACAEALPGWGLADPELVARFARWR